MKKYLKYFLGFGAMAAVVLSTGCEDGDQVFDQIVENETRGAILRTVNIISNELPIGVSDGSFSVDLEIQDQENGTLVQEVEVYVGFSDNSDEIGPGTDVAETLVETISNSTFTVGEFGLPRFSYSITLPELLSIVGRNESDITGGDQFPVRFELVLSDGRRYSSDDNSGTITGSYFSSPFLYTPTVICPIPEGAFTGTYDLTMANPGVFSGGAFTEGPVEITATGGTSRSIATVNYPQFGGFDRTFLFDLICDAILIPEQDQALECTAGTPLIYSPNADANLTYDAADDSVINITFDEDTQGTCGGPVTVSFTLTKV